MSNKINKYLKKEIKFDGILTKKPILLADSKGNYLKEHRYLIENFGYSLEFQCKGGARFQDQLFWLKRNLQFKINQYKDIVLYIWLGTCDLTDKKVLHQKVSSQTSHSGRVKYRKVKYVDLRHKRDADAISYLQFQINTFLNFLSNFPSVKVVFLEIPVYSIVHYNKYLGVENSETFHNNDLILTERIAIINDYIRQINDFLGVTTPRFTRDLIHYRKASRTANQRKSFNFSLYKDGIHPRAMLARCWMKKIVTQIFVDCL